MTRSRWNWLYLLGAVAICLVIGSEAEAQCAKCYWPPPYTNATCGNTYYNSANACVVDGPRCDYLGSCQGQLGDPCEADPRACTFDQWTCGRPLGEEWRLESYTVEHPVAAKPNKDKA